MLYACRSWGAIGVPSQRRTSPNWPGVSLAGVNMATVPCSTCATTLEAHCASPTCHWLRCPKAGCEWSTYDLERGIRVSNRADQVERLDAGPETDQA